VTSVNHTKFSFCIHDFFLVRHFKIYVRHLNFWSDQFEFGPTQLRLGRRRCSVRYTRFHVSTYIGIRQLTSVNDDFTDVQMERRKYNNISSLYTAIGIFTQRHRDHAYTYSCYCIITSIQFYYHIIFIIY
jgi:hypothetical protein